LTLPAVESPRVQRCIEFLALPQQAHPATKADDSASYRAGADNCAAIGTSPWSRCERVCRRIYEMLAGEPPFSDTSTLAIISRHATERLAAPERATRRLRTCLGVVPLSVWAM